MPALRVESSGGLRVGLGCDGIGDAEGSELARAWASSGGLLLIRAGALSPQALVEAASWFGDVEDCHATHVHPRLVLPSQLQQSCSAIMTVTNRRDPATGEPLFPPGPVCEGGEHQVQFPARRGWHTDCSFRWPPPDATLLYCEQPAAAGEADTLIADAAAAYEALPELEQRRLRALRGVHCGFGLGRTERDVLDGVAPSSRDDRPINSAWCGADTRNVRQCPLQRS
jgi:alpha-ketoglutarate-dependent taurine dioxygenase